MNSVSCAAAQYIAMGYPVLPLKAKSKVPDTRHGKKDASADPNTVSAWFPADTERNIGILTGDRSGLLVLDIDPRNGGTDSFERLKVEYGQLPRTRCARTGGGGLHFYFSIPANSPAVGDRPNVGGFSGVDIKADGYVVAAPSIHESGTPYMWESDVPIAIAPDWLIQLAMGKKREKTAARVSDQSIVEGGRNDTLFRLACSLRNRGLSADGILAAVTAENSARCDPPLPLEEVESVVQSAMRYEPNSQHPETELGNARRLVERMAGDARYECASRSWFVWDGRRWAADEGHVSRFAKRVVDDLLSAAKLVDDPETLKRRVAFAHKSQSAARIAAMIELAKTEPGVAIKLDDFDRDADILNVANGMIDLRTGELLPASRSAFATQMIDVDYHPSADCPVFERFVADVLADDQELIDYAHKVVGYAATGETKEQCFFLLHGDGANGKSTFLNALRRVLGGYAKHTPTDTLIAKTGAASNDLARLAGARFVTASEANADQRLADALLKQVTGDEPIVCRFLFKEFISYSPAFKLFLATNHLPQVNGSDPAIWRRIRTVPFHRVFAPEQQDRQLSQKLAAEREGILAWIVRGAVGWYRDGLSTPSAVHRANAEYRGEMDSVGQFLEDRCFQRPAASMSASALYNAYRYHSNDNGQTPVSSTMFGRTLTARGFRAEKRGGDRYRMGLELRQQC